MEQFTEDQVRDKAKEILGFENVENVETGVGQLTTFNQLGFKGISDKPDGWYLPKDKSLPALILEVKSEKTRLEKKCIDEILKNCNIALKKYKQVMGILYNGKETKAFVNGEEI